MKLNSKSSWWIHEISLNSIEIGIKRSKNHKEQTATNHRKPNDTRNKFQNTYSNKENAANKTADQETHGTKTQ